MKNISEELVNKVKELHDKGFKRRYICSALGLSIHTVSEITKKWNQQATSRDRKTFINRLNEISAEMDRADMAWHLVKVGGKIKVIEHLDNIERKSDKVINTFEGVVTQKTDHCVFIKVGSRTETVSKSLLICQTIELRKVG